MYVHKSYVFSRGGNYLLVLPDYNRQYIHTTISPANRFLERKTKPPYKRGQLLASVSDLCRLRQNLWNKLQFTPGIKIFLTWTHFQRGRSGCFITHLRFKLTVLCGVFTTSVAMERCFIRQLPVLFASHPPLAHACVGYCKVMQICSACNLYLTHTFGHFMATSGQQTQVVKTTLCVSAVAAEQGVFF